MIRRVLMLVGMGACALLGAGTAQAAGSEHYSVRGSMAEAGFDSQAGCIDTSAYVFGANGRVKQTGRPASATEVDLYVSQYNVCTDEYISFAYGSLQPSGDELRIRKNLSSATLNATVQVTDQNDNTYPVQVDVTWTGVGSATKQHGHNVYSTDGFKESTTYSGVFRDATASGTITDGQTNYTPEPAAWADIGKNSFNDIVVVH